jgi:hypothetical protein
MQDSLNSISDDEIDLRELFVTLWAYKLFIACACALGIVFGGYYALNIRLRLYLKLTNRSLAAFRSVGSSAHWQA